MIKGSVKINDGKFHKVALRYEKEQYKWAIFVDGQEDCSSLVGKDKEITENTADPYNSQM